MNLTVEEALRRAEEKAATLRYLSDLASSGKETPDPMALAGLGSILAEIEDMLCRARRSLDVHALSTEMRR